MKNTRSKIWLKSTNGPDVTEVIATDYGIIMDVYSNKWQLVRQKMNEIKTCLFNSSKVGDKDAVKKIVNSYIETYYEENERDYIAGNFIADIDGTERKVERPDYVY